jgi:hypothetical protein
VFRYTAGDLGGLVDASTLAVWEYSEATGWELVGGTVDVGANTVSVLLDHFSAYAILGTMPALMDVDADAVVDAVDNCPGSSNPTQRNSDALPMGNGSGVPGDDGTVPNADAAGDTCDSDDDNDGIPDASDVDPGAPRDLTIDDDGDGAAAMGCYSGVDPADDGTSWDLDCNGALDGGPTDCGSTIRDNDNDGLLDAWEGCKWGTSNNDVDSDGDGLGDCTEAMDVNGNGLAGAADATLIAQAFFDMIARDVAFDINGNGFITTGDRTLVLRAVFGLSPCS